MARFKALKVSMIPNGKYHVTVEQTSSYWFFWEKKTYFSATGLVQWAFKNGDRCPGYLEDWLNDEVSKWRWPK